jgi:hypothetical protein
MPCGDIPGFVRCRIGLGAVMEKCGVKKHFILRAEAREIAVDQDLFVTHNGIGCKSINIKGGV